MTETSTDYGRLIIGPKDKLFARAVALVAETRSRPEPVGRAFTVAFSGGSTPQEWYRWCVEQNALPATVTAGAHFTVSDERHVPTTDDQSNFGHVDRLLLGPLNIPSAHRHPWPVELAPAAAVEAYRTTMRSLAPPGLDRAYDVCFLGMGDDGHTASLFPGSALLCNEGEDFFAALETPGKGWRLTITPAGLRTCGLVVVLALGAGKAAILARALRGPHDPSRLPVQVLRASAARTIWLTDEVAAAGL